jgi:large subunit ribosomal protein L10
MQRSEKETVVQDVTEIFQKAKSVFVTDYEGLTVEKMSVLRQKFRASAVEYRVVKNTLAKMAADKAGKGEINAYFKGPSAIAYSFEDASAPARIIKEFFKDNQKPKVKFTIFEGEFLGPERLDEIAALPSRTVLIARVLGGFNAPIQGLAGALGGILSKLVRTVDAVRESRAKTDQ